MLCTYALYRTSDIIDIQPDTGYILGKSVSPYRSTLTVICYKIILEYERIYINNKVVTLEILFPEDNHKNVTLKEIRL